jgi:hypothetical protein
MEIICDLFSEKTKTKKVVAGGKDTQKILLFFW